MSSEVTKKFLTWNSDIEYALGFFKIVNQLLGTWPFESQTLFSEIRLVVVIMLQVIVFVHCCYEIRSDCVESDKLVTIVSILGLSTMVTIKVASLRLNRARMEFVITSVIEDWKNVKDPNSLKIMKNYAFIGRTGFIVATVIIVVPFSLVVLTSLPKFGDGEMMINNSVLMLNDSYIVNPPISTTPSERSLPMGTGCFVANFPISLYVTYYIFQVIQGAVMTIGDIGNDMNFLCITFHICGQFKLLIGCLERFGEHQDVPSCRKELRVLVGRYNHLMTIAQYLEDIFNPIILGVLAANAIYMCLMGLQVIMCAKDDDYARVTQGIFSINTLCLQLFLYSYAGERLSSLNCEIREAAYNCRWYDLPPTIVKDIVMIILRCGSEFNLTAGKIVHMNLNNFKVIMKTMFSYFSMLRIMVNM